MYVFDFSEKLTFATELQLTCISQFLWFACTGAELVVLSNNQYPYLAKLEQCTLKYELPVTLYCLVKLRSPISSQD